MGDFSMVKGGNVMVHSMKPNLNTREGRPVESNVSVWERVPIDIGRIEFRLDYKNHKAYRSHGIQELRILHVTDRASGKCRAYPLFRIALKGTRVGFNENGFEHKIGWEGITPANRYGPFYGMNAKRRALECVLEEFELDFIEWVD